MAAISSASSAFPARRWPEASPGWIEIIHPSDRAPASSRRSTASARARIQSRTKDVRHFTSPIACAARTDRSSGWRTAGTSFVTPRGKPSRMVGFVEDISERTRHYEALRSSEERFGQGVSLQSRRHRDQPAERRPDPGGQRYLGGTLRLPPRRGHWSHTPAQLGIYVVAGRTGRDSPARLPSPAARARVRDGAPQQGGGPPRDPPLRRHRGDGWRALLHHLHSRRDGPQAGGGRGPGAAAWRWRI